MSRNMVELNFGDGNVYKPMSLPRICWRSLDHLSPPPFTILQLHVATRPGSCNRSKPFCSLDMDAATALLFFFSNFLSIVARYSVI